MAEGAEQKNWETPLVEFYHLLPSLCLFLPNPSACALHRGEEAALCKELLQQAKSAWFQAGVNTSAGVRQLPALATKQNLIPAASPDPSSSLGPAGELRSEFCSIWHRASLLGKGWQTEPG